MFGTCEIFAGLCLPMEWMRSFTTTEMGTDQSHTSRLGRHRSSNETNRCSRSRSRSGTSLLGTRISTSKIETERDRPVDNDEHERVNSSSSSSAVVVDIGQCRRCIDGSKWIGWLCARCCLASCTSSYANPFVRRCLGKFDSIRFNVNNVIRSR
jgi:hypothetical protein